MKATARKPRILFIGGELSRNFGSKDLREAFDIEIVEKKKTTIPRFKDEDFDAVVILPWHEKNMTGVAKKWASARGIPCFNVRSVGTVRQYLADQLPRVKEYIEHIEREAKEKGKPSKEAARKEEAPSEAPTPAMNLWDEDQLWSAYGEPFVNSIRGLDGETCDQKTFISLVEDETGLKGEPVDILISILRRQGVITEHEGGVIAIGKVMVMDIEKRKKFIEREEKKFGRKASLDAKNAVSEVVAASEGFGAIHMPDDELMKYFEKLSGKRFESSKALFDALGDAGLGKNGKRFSDNWMRTFLFRVEKLGVRRERTGHRYEFVLEVPSDSSGNVAEEVQEPPAPPPVQPAAPVQAEVHVSTSTERGGSSLTSKPFESIFKPEPKAVVQASPPAAVPSTVNPDTLDIGKEGVLYEMLEKKYPGGRLPGLGGLVPAVRAFRGLFYDNQWDISASKGILSRAALDFSEPNLRKAISRKLDFTDDEWAYFALEFLRDQTLFSLLPMIDVTNRLWKICEECEQHFHYNIPRMCKGCWDKHRSFIADAKGGGEQ